MSNISISSNMKIKHKNYRDIYLDIHITYQNDKVIKFKGWYINQGYTGKPWPIMKIPNSLGFILKSDLPNWIVL